MRLRTRLIALFLGLATLPLATLGVFEYLQSRRALQALVGDQASLLARSAADLIVDRHARRRSDLVLLAENTETQRLYRGDSTGAADAYLRALWRQMSPAYHGIVLQDRHGRQVYRLGEATEERESQVDPTAEGVVLTQPVRDAGSGAPIGEIVATVRATVLLPLEAFQARFGRGGYTVVVDRRADRVLHHPRRAFLSQPVDSLLGTNAWRSERSLLERPRGRFVFEEADTTHVAGFVSLADPPWTVIATAAVDEFAPPFGRIRAITLGFVLLVTAAVSVAFPLMIRRATGSLERLGIAADEIGSGNFRPTLPPAGPDEIGRLTRAVAAMAAQIDRMVREITASRQMSVVGQFAAQISHEIRNPLTSIKLNLQGLAREAEAGRLPVQTQRPLGICLREVQRLDRVVRGVLDLAHAAPPPAGTPCSLHTAVRDALDVVRPQLDRQRITVRADLAAPDDWVVMNADAVRGTCLNLFLNAADAMPDGGELHITTDLTPPDRSGPAVLELAVRDTGRGVPAEMRERIFEPFYTTKTNGVGLGLAVALGAVERVGGTLTLEDTSGVGALFVARFPVASGPPRS